MRCVCCGKALQQEVFNNEEHLCHGCFMRWLEAGGPMPMEQFICDAWVRAHGPNGGES